MRRQAPSGEEKRRQSMAVEGDGQRRGRPVEQRHGPAEGLRLQLERARQPRVHGLAVQRVVGDPGAHRGAPSAVGRRRRRIVRNRRGGQRRPSTRRRRHRRRSPPCWRRSPGARRCRRRPSRCTRVPRRRTARASGRRNSSSRPPAGVGTRWALDSRDPQRRTRCPSLRADPDDRRSCRVHRRDRVDRRDMNEVPGWSSPSRSQPGQVPQNVRYEAKLAGAGVA